ncbi:MAG: hypothetical protein KGH94_04375 [Candidatus Micrarchaeota archaeon]|nr:hypothetical protein [Candidatus Micrarchaeota archaeon]
MVEKSRRFEKLNLPSLPERNAEGIREFIEGISSFSMLSLSGRKLPEVPAGARVFSSSTLENAFKEANFAWACKDILRRVTFRKPMELDSIFEDGCRMIPVISKIHRRSSDVQLAMETARDVAKDELSRKISGAELMTMTAQIPISAAFMAGMKAVEDINFEGKRLFLDHASERWKLIEDGFCIYAYDGPAPYLFYQKGDGDSGGFGSRFGPLKFT